MYPLQTNAVALPSRARFSAHLSPGHCVETRRLDAFLRTGNPRKAMITVAFGPNAFVMAREHPIYVLKFRAITSQKLTACLY